MENNYRKNVSISINIPSIVVGVLIALKHIGMTNISYGSIILFGIEVWAICIAIVVIIWLLIAFFTMK